MPIAIVGEIPRKTGRIARQSPTELPEEPNKRSCHSDRTLAKFIQKPIRGMGESTKMSAGMFAYQPAMPKLKYITLILLWGLCTGGTNSFAENGRKTPPRETRKQIDYRNPRRDYEAMRFGTLSVHVERQLTTEAPELVESVLTRLQKRREDAISALPEFAAGELRNIPFFVMYGPKARDGGHANGMAYFRKGAPEFHDWIDERWGHSVVIYHAENFSGVTDLWALKALVHEFGHAYHLTRWPEEYPLIFDTWKSAIDEGLYLNAKDVTGKVHEAAYARVNQLEYFAELTAIFFAGGNYTPRNRMELEAYDPRGASLIKKLWSVEGDKSREIPSQ